MAKAKKTKSKKRSKVTIDKKNTILLGVGIIIVLVLGFSLNGNFGFANLFTILSSEKNYDTMLIEPSSAEIKIGESVTFMSYTKTGTGQIPVNANWRIATDDEVKTLSEESAESTGLSELNNDDVFDLFTQDELEALLKLLEDYFATPPASTTTTVNRGILLENCQNVSSCKVISGIDPEEVTLTAERADGRQAETKVTVLEILKPSVFKETIPAWAEKVVAAMQERGIMKGYENGDFGVTDPVTRTQMIVLLNKIMKLYAGEQNIAAGTSCDVYRDVPSTHFAYDAVCFAHYAGWLKNLDTTSSGTLQPEQALKRREVAYLIVNTAAGQIFNNRMKVLYTGTPHTDFAATASSYSRAVFNDVNQDKDSVTLGIVGALRIMSGTRVDGSGYAPRYFKPEQEINRVETAVMLWNFMEIIELNSATEVWANDDFVDEE